MATKREMQKQIDCLRKQLKEHEDLLRLAAIKFANLQTSKSALAATREAMMAEKVRRENRGGVGSPVGAQLCRTC